MILTCILSQFEMNIMYGIMNEELIIREIRIDEAAGDLGSRMTSFGVLSTKILIYMPSI